MVYIFTALYCEAHIFIKHFNLIKNQESTWFQQFYNDAAGIRLTITGVGEIAAASVVSSVCSIYKPTQSDLLLNVGICAHTGRTGGIFLCNKIAEEATGKTFYPDMLYRNNFPEAPIVTGMLLWNTDTGNPKMQPYASLDSLYDMEAAAVYQAGIHFFGPHQMIFLKIVSDHGNVKDISSERITLLMEQYQDCIIDYIRQISDITQKAAGSKKHPYEEDEQFFETFCTDLHCSKAMRDSMRQYIQYLKLAKIDYVSLIQDMYEKKLLPCKDKKEGKRRFEEFRKKLF